MKTAIRVSFYLITIFLTYACFPTRRLPENTTILPLSDTVSLRKGSIIYSLPRTVFTVTVEMERTIEKPGPYSQFAGDLLGLSDVIRNESESWSIEGVSIKTHEELDPSEFYVIESNSLFQTNVLALRNEGLILDLNPGIYSSDINMGENKSGAINQFYSFDLGSDEYFQLQRDTAYKRISVDSAFIRIPYIVEKKKKLSVEVLAEKAAKRLMELRDGKHLILTGEANVFPQSEAPIIEMNRLEKEYTELFTGKSWKETRSFTYQVIPEREMVKKPVILFQFSELIGPVTGKEKGGRPVTLDFLPEKKTKDLTNIINKSSEPSTPKNDKLFYRVPDVVNLKIALGTEILLSSRRLIYQFGEVVQLPENYIIGK